MSISTTETAKPENPTPLDKLAEELNQVFPPGGEEGAPAAAPAELLDEGTMRMFLAVPFDYIAARKGPHWKLSPEELAALLPVACKVSNKYAPAILARWADELALAAILGVILFKRVNLDGEKAAAEKIEPASPGAGAPVESTAGL